jgi:hypothetical protein
MLHATSLDHHFNSLPHRKIPLTIVSNNKVIEMLDEKRKIEASYSRQARTYIFVLKTRKAKTFLGIRYFKWKASAIEYFTSRRSYEEVKAALLEKAN